MKRFSSMMAVVVLGATLMAGAAHAAGSMVHVGVGASAVLPMGDLKDANYSTGYGGRLMVGVMPEGKNYGLVAEGGYNQIPGDDTSVQTDRKFNVLSGTLGALFLIPTQSNMQPWVKVGFGAYNTKFKWMVGTTAVDASTTALGFNGGLGLSFKMAGGRAFGVDATLHSMSKDGSTQIYVPLGVHFMFM